MTIATESTQVDVKDQTTGGSDEVGTRAAERTAEVASFVRQQVPLRPPLNISPVADLGAGVEGDLGLQLVDASEGGEAVNIVVGPLTGSSNPTPRVIASNIPLADAPARLTRLAKTFMVEGCAHESFATWASNQSEEDLRARLGVR